MLRPSARHPSCLLVLVLVLGPLCAQLVEMYETQTMDTKDPSAFLRSHMEFGAKNHLNSQYRMGTMDPQKVYKMPTRPGVTVYTSGQQPARPQRQQERKQAQQPPSSAQQQARAQPQPQPQPQVNSYDLGALKRAEENLDAMMVQGRAEEMFIVSARLIEQLALIVNNERAPNQDRRIASIIMAHTFYKRASTLCSVNGDDIDRIILARDEAERVRILCDNVGLTDPACSIDTGSERVNLAAPLIKLVEETLLGNLDKKKLYALLRKFHPDKNVNTSPELTAWRNEATIKLNEMKPSVLEAGAKTGRR